MKFVVIGGTGRIGSKVVAILREKGWGSLLMVPIVAAGEAIGLLEVHSREERPWSRSDLHRAHMVAPSCAEPPGLRGTLTRSRSPSASGAASLPYRV